MHRCLILHCLTYVLTSKRGLIIDSDQPVVLPNELITLTFFESYDHFAVFWYSTYFPCTLRSKKDVCFMFWHMLNLKFMLLCPSQAWEGRILHFFDMFKNEPPTCPCDPHHELHGPAQRLCQSCFRERQRNGLFLGHVKF